ncbi:MAG: hypothetical protein M1504_03910 [Candidatus Marsarchaeota archaeon]|nr:hypothetical protein [Candidatus Marsarchaeota archaeon]
MAVSLANAGVVNVSSAPPPPNFNITTNITNVCKGMENYVPVTIYNDGDPAIINPGSPNALGPAMVNIVLTALNTKNEYYTSNYTITIGQIGPSQNVTRNLQWFVPQNTSTTATLDVGLKYYFDTFYEDSEARNLSFSADSCQLPLVLNMSPKILASGDIENLSIILHNTGASTLNTITVTASAPTSDMAQITTTPMQLQSLAPGASAVINDLVYVPKNASLSFPLNITADFYDNGTFEQAASYKEALAQGTIDLAASSVTVSPTTTSAGGIFSISFVLTDTGNSGASSISVYSKPTKDFSVFGTNSTFVGSLSAEGQSPVTLTFVVQNDTKPGQYDVPIVVNYLDNFRDNLSETITVPVTVAAAGKLAGAAAGPVTKVGTYYGGGGILFLLILVLIVVVVVFAYLYYKEKRGRHSK